MLIDPRLRVLVIDDDPAVCVLLASAPRRFNLDVETASDGSAGLALANARTFDVILLDLRMPGTSGLQVLRSLRAGGNSTPIVIWTGFGESESALEAGRLGVRRYLKKPMRLSAVLDALREAGAARPSPIEPLQGHDLAARRESAWSRTKSWLETQLEEGYGKRTTAALPGILNLFVDGSTDAATTLPHFVHLAKIARAALAEPQAFVRRAEELLASAAGATALGDRIVQPEAACVLAAFTQPLGLHEPMLARELGQDVSTVRRHLSLFFACSFDEMRWAALIRPAVAPVARSTEPISNIAIDCGCATASRRRQFERAWVNLLGVSAGEFRKR